MLNAFVNPKNHSDQNMNSKNSSKEIIRPNHQPSWMYRNE